MKRLHWRILGFVVMALLWSAIMIWTQLWYLLFFNLVIFDIFITKKVDWTLRKYRLPRFLQSVIEWTALLIIAIVSSFAIKTLFLEAYKIPTPSMEETFVQPISLRISL